MRKKRKLRARAAEQAERVEAGDELEGETASADDADAISWADDEDEEDGELALDESEDEAQVDESERAAASEGDGDVDLEAGAEAEADEDGEAEAADLDGEAKHDAPEGDGAIDGELDGEVEPAAAAEAELAPDPDAELKPDFAVDQVRLRSILESLLFAAEKPLTPLELRRMTGCSDAAAIQAALDALLEEYCDRGIALYDVAGGFQFRTHPSNSEYVQRLIAGRPVRLSRAQLETLSIIAYRQPITRPEIDEIRGVDSGSTLKVLLDRSLIRVLGKKEEPGRPLLYGTSKEFLEFFNLRELRDLPTLREFHELTEESLREVEALDQDARSARDPADPGDGSHARGEAATVADDQGDDDQDDDDGETSAAVPH